MFTLNTHSLNLQSFKQSDKAWNVHRYQTGGKAGLNFPEIIMYDKGDGIDDRCRPGFASGSSLIGASSQHVEALMCLVKFLNWRLTPALTKCWSLSLTTAPSCVKWKPVEIYARLHESHRLCLFLIYCRDNNAHFQFCFGLLNKLEWFSLFTLSNKQMLANNSLSSAN